MLKIRSFHSDSKASVAVEFAMVSSFFLFPLFSGVADCVEIISAQAQLNTAVQALYYDAWNNPSLAATTTSTSTSTLPATNTAEMQTVLAAIRPGGMTNMTLGGVAGTVSYACYTPGSTATPITVAASGDCSNLTNPTAPQQQTWVTYQVNATVNLTFPFPGLPSTVPLIAKGQVEVQ
jgi:hypothetical protein